jgi:hypothetical protein
MIHTFSATGQSAGFFPPKDFSVDLTGAGTGAVDLQRFVGGEWVTIQTLAKDDPYVGFEPSRKIPYRFDCTSISGGDLTASVQ